MTFHRSLTSLLCLGLLLGLAAAQPIRLGVYQYEVNTALLCCCCAASVTLLVLLSTSLLLASGPRLLLGCRAP